YPRLSRNGEGPGSSSDRRAAVGHGGAGAPGLSRRLSITEHLPALSNRSVEQGSIGGASGFHRRRVGEECRQAHLVAEDELPVHKPFLDRARRVIAVEVGNYGQAGFGGPFDQVGEEGPWDRAVGVGTEPW